MNKLNSFLRIFFVLFGALFLLMELLPEKRAAEEAAAERREGFENEEFDDIW